MQITLIRRFILYFGTILIFAASENAQQPLHRLPAQPQSLTKKVPRYPPIARAACVQGSVAVLVEIDSTGKATATDVLYGHPLLMRVAKDSANEWTFDAAKELGQRREVIRFSFQILPFEFSEKKLKPVWATATDVEIRVHPPEPSCDHCSEKRRRELRRGGCPAQPLSIRSTGGRKAHAADSP